MAPQKSFKLGKHSHSPVGWFFVIVSLALVGLGVALAPIGKPENPHEESLSFEEDRDAFWKEVEESDGRWVENSGLPVWENQALSALPQKYPGLSKIAHNAHNVLGFHLAENGAEKWIDVDISEQRLRAYEGDHLAFDFWVSTGKDGYETVQGEFRVWYKVKYKAYRGGSRRRGDYYYLPNVPFSLFFYKGYAIHGAYWHNDFGVARRSRGCVNMRPEEAELLWHWAAPAVLPGKNAVRPTKDNPGIRVVVHE